MNKQLIMIGFCLAIPFFGFCQVKRIAVVGSSTAYGFGADPRADSSWVNLTKKYFRHLGEIDTIYNLGNPSTTTYDGMPTGFIPPAGRNSPDPAHNINKALSFNPDLVIINYPTNDFGDDYPISDILSNLHTMYNAVKNAGKECYITTTQPRNTLSPAERITLIAGRDSILLEFGSHALNFFDPLADPDPAQFGKINPKYNADNVHPNNAGHNLLFQVIKNNISLASAPAAPSITSFSVESKEKNAVLHWTSADERIPTTYEVQRSWDGSSFNSIHLENGMGSGSASYSWTDIEPLAGNNFYRLKMIYDTITSYSIVIKSVSDQKELIRKMTSSGINLEVEINVLQKENVNIVIYQVSGKLVYMRSYDAAQPAAKLYVPISGISAGLYIIKIMTDDGHFQIRSFNKLSG